MMKVIGIGQCSWDYLCIVRSFPSPDTKEEIMHLEQQGGGPVATALVALKRLGVTCTMHGVIGDDQEGARIRESLSREGIDNKGLLARKGTNSQVALIVIDRKDASRTIFWRRPTGEPLMPEELGRGFLKGARFLLLDGLMKDISLYAAKLARSKGIPVMLDAGRIREGMIEIGREADYVVGSEEFATELGYSGNAEGFFKKTRGLFPGVFTITLGSKGSITKTAEEIIITPAFKVQAVDTTGAGDVFHGGYLYALLKGWRLRETLRFASAMAALACTKIGGRGGIPSLEDVSRLLKSN